MATKKTLGFKTWRENHERVYSSSGSPIKPVYSGKYDVKGRLVIEEVGKKNLYEYIQSYAEMCDINNIMKRFENGETDILSKVQGFYFDVTQVPDNMAELLNKLNLAQDGFDKLPAEFRERYGNDFAQFICTFDPKDFMQVIETEEPVIEKEGETDE